MTTKSRVAKEPVADTVVTAPLGAEELRRMHARWRACNYLAVGMIYLRDNPLLGPSGPITSTRRSERT